MSIIILCPTRGRPEQFQRMLKSAKDTSTSVGVFPAFDYDEKDVHGYLGKDGDDIASLIFPSEIPTVYKWNFLAERAMKLDETKLFMLGSDDMYFDTPGWDKALLDHYNALENKIHAYAFLDSRDSNGTPHPVVTREYIQAMGYFIPPIFLHWFVDTWTVEICKSNDCFTHFRDYRLIHDKPSDKGNADETHSRIRQWGWHERDKWVNEKCQIFQKVEENRLRAKIYDINYSLGKFS